MKIRYADYKRSFHEAAIELIDNLTMRCVEANAPIGLPLDAEAILIFGVDGNYEAVIAEELATNPFLRCDEPDPLKSHRELFPG